MDERLRAGRFFAPLVRGASSQLDDIKRQHERLAAIVDSFYSVAGGKGWIFLSRFHVEEIAEATQAGPDAVDDYLSAWFESEANLGWLVANAVTMPGLVERRPMLELARDDTLAGRYYSAVNLLLSVMDGFVNDEDRTRRAGLHAREPDSMVAWDNVVGHSAGMVSALKLYRQHFGRLEPHPVTNLYRHGIVHGMVVNFNNALVSGKAWNLLAALIDWTRADSESRLPKPAQPTWGEVAAKVARNQTNARLLNEWQPRVWERGAGVLDDLEPLVVATRELFDGWQNHRWGDVASRIDDLRNLSPGARAGEMKQRFQDFPIGDWKLLRYELKSPQFADVTCELIVGSAAIETETKWFFVGEDGNFQFEFEPGGVWRSIHTHPDEYGVS